MNSYAKKYENNQTQPKVNNKDLRWSQQPPKVDDGLNKENTRTNGSKQKFCMIHKYKNSVSMVDFEQVNVNWAVS